VRPQRCHPQAAIDVSRAHTAFRVKLWRGEDGAYEAFVSYTVSIDGSYALFTDPRVEVTVVAPPVFHVGETSAIDSCAELPWVSTFTFYGGEHLLRVRAPRPNVVLVFERVDVL